MVRSNPVRLPVAFAVIGVLLALLGVALVTERRSSEQGRLDRTLATTSGAKAALVGTELERARALALVTARIPPFSELYADSDSLAAKIAAVAGPFREINNALDYDYQLYPSRFVEVGYVDVSGRERARVLDGRKLSPTALSSDVRAWPSFSQGISTPLGTTRFTLPFVSPSAHVPVTAATTTVAVNGRVRAYVEIELALSSLQRVLSSDLPKGTVAEIVDRNGKPLTATGPAVTVPRADLGLGLTTAGHLRVAVRQVSEGFVAGGPWWVVSAARAPSAISLAVAPEQGVILLFSLLSLLAAVAGFRRGRRVVADRLAAEQRAREEAERRARIDGLTGLFNRRHLVETLEHELARAGRQDGAVGLLMFDIDFFKRINDAHGHAGGDAVLIEVAHRLQLGVRSWDIVARVGGEEFCIVAPDIDDEVEVAELGDRLRQAVAERAITLKQGLAIPVTISVGVALLRSEDGSAEHAFDCADRALYAAKRRGRNRIVRFSQLDHSDLRAEQPECLHLAEALAVTGDLREGLTAEHSRAVAELSARVAEQLGLDEDEVLRARLGGWLHDIGKIAVPDGILTKRGKLTDAEWEIIKTHPVIGEELVLTFPELSLASKAVRHHHERWDGRGYPTGLANEDIPLEARIVGVVDAYSAMISERPYQRSRSAADAIAELRGCAGKQFDPAIVDVLVSVIEATADASRRPAAA